MAGDGGHVMWCGSVAAREAQHARAAAPQEVGCCETFAFGPSNLHGRRRQGGGVIGAAMGAVGGPIGKRCDRPLAGGLAGKGAAEVVNPKRATTAASTTSSLSVEGAPCAGATRAPRVPCPVAPAVPAKTRKPAPINPPVRPPVAPPAPTPASPAADGPGRQAEAGDRRDRALIAPTPWGPWLSRLGREVGNRQEN